MDTLPKMGMFGNSFGHEPAPRGLHHYPWCSVHQSIFDRFQDFTILILFHYFQSYCVLVEEDNQPLKSVHTLLIGGKLFVEQRSWSRLHCTKYLVKFKPLASQAKCLTTTCIWCNILCDLCHQMVGNQQITSAQWHHWCTPTYLFNIKWISLLGDISHNFIILWCNINVVTVACIFRFIKPFYRYMYALLSILQNHL